MVNTFDAPVPGQSLTRAPGSRPYEQPPMYADPEDAAKAMQEALMGNKKNAAAAAILLEKGVPASVIANGILKTGVVMGKWTPDVALLISKRTIGAVVATGTSLGVKDIIYAPAKEDPLQKLVSLPSLRGKEFAKDSESDVTSLEEDEESPSHEAMSSDMSEDLTEGEPKDTSISKGMSEDVTGSNVMSVTPAPERPSLDSDVTQPLSRMPME